MNREMNIQLHLNVIRLARQRYSPGTSKRMHVIHNSIQGIIRAKSIEYIEEEKHRYQDVKLSSYQEI